MNRPITPIVELPPAKAATDQSASLERPKVIVETYDPAVSAAKPKRPDPARWLVFNVIAPLAILAAGVGIIFGLGKIEPGRRPAADASPTGRLKSLPPIRTVAIESLATTGARLQLDTDGEVVPYHEANVAAEVAGRIVEKNPICEAGQYVRAGQALMTIDPTDTQLEVERLQQSQEQAYESLKEIDQELENTGRLIDVAKQDVALQIREVRRQRNLPEGFNTGRDIDAAEKSLLNAQQSLVTQENRVATLKAQRSSLQISEKLAATQLRAAQVNLDRTHIKAPIDGIIVSENADVDTFVTRGMMLVTIETTEKVEIDSKLRADQLYWVLNQKHASGATDGSASEVGDRTTGYELPQTDAIITYEVSGLENQVYHWLGKLVSYDGIGLDPMTRTVPVRIVVDNPHQYINAAGDPIDVRGGPALVRGTFVTISLLIQPTKSLLVIPANAMLPGNRVLEFVSDPSVLEVKPSAVAPTVAADEPVAVEPVAVEPVADEPVAVESVAVDAATSGENESFDPSQWTPGMIKLRSGIVPIDSLTVAGGNQLKLDADDENELSEKPGLDSSKRRWVCEVPEGSITAGALVVVSPVADFAGDTLPARAAKPSMQSPTFNRSR